MIRACNLAWIAVLVLCLMLSSIQQAFRVSRQQGSRSLTSTRAMTEGGAYTYKWPRPALTVDAVIVSQPQAAAAKLLLIQRKHPPCQGQWALPGGFVDEGEPLEQAAARELQEETSVDPSRVPLIQVGAFGDPGRDPRGWTVTVAYAALVPSTELGAKAADDAQAAKWFSLRELPALAFDHKQVIREALEKLAALEEAKNNAQLLSDLEAGVAALQGPWTKPTE